jgi:hypothetical protein
MIRIGAGRVVAAGHGGVSIDASFEAQLRRAS